MIRIDVYGEAAAFPVQWAQRLHARGHQVRFVSTLAGAVAESGEVGQIALAVSLLSADALRAEIAGITNPVLAAIPTGAEAAPWLAAGAVDAVEVDATGDWFLHRVELLVRLARAQQALETAQAQVKRLTVTDAATGVANRAHFLSQAHHELSRSVRFEEPLALMMLAIDGFDSMVQTHGEPQGEAALQATARLCQDAVRQVDVVGRMGTGEFGICCPETGLDGAKVIAERIRGLCRATELPAVGGALTFTLSIGVTVREPLEMDLSAVLTRADRGLQQARKNGGDRVVIARRA
ncbi:MAG: GGDEF domain-containing protein [Pseudomonadota bacterium]|nr:GGDEF domain-containing protein [Pseudomonadota bacterium]